MEGIKQRHEYQEVEIMEDQLRVCPPEAHTKIISESLMGGLFTERGLGKIQRSQQGILKNPRSSNSSSLYYSKGGKGAGKYIL